jgi:hypothetical protein
MMEGTGALLPYLEISKQAWDSMLLILLLAE